MKRLMSLFLGLALVTGLTLTAAPAEAAPEQAPEQATGQASQALCATPAPGTFGFATAGFVPAGAALPKLLRT